MTHARPGRPRLHRPRRPGSTARAEILDAAAELFTTRGFASTSTRLVAEAVGVRQASLYNHFATKDDILAALLEQTVAPTLSFCEQLGDDPPPEARLYALALFDTAQLVTGRWNLGALYLLPEVRTDRFTQFHAARTGLRACYRRLAVAVLGRRAAGADADDPRADLPFRLVESAINIRADGDTAAVADLPEVLAEAALRVLGFTGPVEPVREVARALVARVAASS
ncbi:helix-turn-helix domain-containing protein [Rhodococcus sp. CSLK01-03]|uniref:Helix-turn-helix domain-containing protein n=1 Tax=Rhodococcus indonesiensis TaxID=3055869 RepID=A0ABT7RPC0_9NOCA|nr:TetR/AcrR family transcriptional regulator [Rhodococcus indonesiensis]MDM7489489.1 helix-turn-helix domain-containing protein [Rhodococcus indonesiensis]